MTIKLFQINRIAEIAIPTFKGISNGYTNNILIIVKTKLTNTNQYTCIQNFLNAD